MKLHSKNKNRSLTESTYQGLYKHKYKTVAHADSLDITVLLLGSILYHTNAIISYKLLTNFKQQTTNIQSLGISWENVNREFCTLG